ncbi:MAG TPA: RNA polymerase sigma factor region1.1 domain-containing protein, partial [Hyphomicrobiaceae bacterium]|nr:RNA polymerase sigma factor region1.1 domain-containing protein [Hyphomicrobiaceae bacterium]
MAMTAKTEDQAAAPADAPEKDSPLLDLSDAAVKKFIKMAKARGFVTLDALNAVLPSEEVSPDQIEDTMSMLSDMGITVVESEDADEAVAPADTDDTADDEEPTRAVTVAAASLPATTQARAEPAERTDDPVRM